MILVLAIAPFREYGLGAYGFAPGLGLLDVGELEPVPYTPFENPVDFVAGLVGLANNSEGSGGFLFNFPRENPNAELDLLFVKLFGVGGEGRFGFPLERGAREEPDCWSVVDVAGGSSVEVVVVVGSGSGRGGGGETLLRG
jgi:hypothetical protein